MLAAACAAVWLAAGCSSVNAFKTARPLGDGVTQVHIGTQANAGGSLDTARTPIPELAVGVRRGVGDSLDVGVAASGLYVGRLLQTGAVEAMAKRRVWSSARLDLAVAAAAGYRALASSGAVYEVIHASAATIVGVNLGRHQIVISPAATWQRWYSQGIEPLDIPSVGASLGFLWAVSRRVAILPELSWSYTPVELRDVGPLVMGHVGLAITYRRP